MAARKKAKRAKSKGGKRVARRQKPGLATEAKKTGKKIGAVLRSAIKTVGKSRKKVTKALGV
jgi:hypothetical protein